MIRPDYAVFRRSYNGLLSHSAKGSEWENHKYIKKINGVYYYPVGYEDGRTIDSLKNGSSKNKEEASGSSDKINEVKDHFDQYLAKRGIDWRTLPKDEVEQMQRDIVKQLESGKEPDDKEKTTEELAKDVVAGKLGVGEDRKALLGEKYKEVQEKVNELMKGTTGSKKVSEATEESVRRVSEVLKKVQKVKVNPGVYVNRLY